VLSTKVPHTLLSQHLQVLPNDWVFDDMISGLVNVVFNVPPRHWPGVAYCPRFKRWIQTILPKKGRLRWDGVPIEMQLSYAGHSYDNYGKRPP